MSKSPLWRQAFDAWEKAVAPGLQDLTASPGFTDVLATGLRANAAVAEQAERLSRQWLHLWNLPAATDVRRLRQQISTLEQEVRMLRRAVGESASAADPAESTETTDGDARILDLVDDGRSKAS